MTAVLAAVGAAATVLCLPAVRPRPVTRLRRLVAAAGPGSGAATPPTWPARHRWTLMAAGGPLLAIVAGMPPVTVVAGPGALVVLALARRRARRREVQVRRHAVVELTFALAAELRAGRPPGQALAAAAAAGPLAAPMGAAADAVASGTSAVAALHRCSELPGAGGLRSIAAAWAVTEQAGGPVADVLDRLGVALDADTADREALDALLAGPRATMSMLAGLPAVGVALGTSIGARPVHLLLHTGLGWALLAAAGVLDVVGVGWVAGLTTRALRG